MQSGVARNGAVQIAYEVFGKPGGRPLLLINGLDGQMIGWPDAFCDALVEAGFQVVRYDHRDTGLSTHFEGRKLAYSVSDMIDDMMSVLDAMGWESANLVGISMGGGLAQFAALQRPERIRTLTAISATPQFGNQLLLFRHIRFPGPFKLAFRRYGDSPQEKQRMLMDVTRLAAARSLPLDEEWIAQIAEEAVRRRYPDPEFPGSPACRGPRGEAASWWHLRDQPAGAGNQRGRGSDRAALGGPEDGGDGAERAVVLMHRLGHLFSPPLWPLLVSQIERHAT